MRKKLYDVVQPSDNNSSTLSLVYGWFMIAVIIINLVSLVFKNNETGIFEVIDTVWVITFIIYTIHIVFSFDF